MSDFENGKKIGVVGGGNLVVLEKLGEGGQGIVYKVDYNGKKLALKWYFGDKLKDKIAFYENIKNNIAKGAPTKNFLWPLYITEQTDESFGYLMELRPQQYKDFSKFLLVKERFNSIAAMINAALQITTAFRALHSKGFSYQDLNDGNFFVNPITGDVLICDNDNVAPYGNNLGIAGKCRYMAPEVVMNKKVPDLHTDRFSLAVVLYLLLFLNHPLEGARTMCPCLTEEKEKKFYGSNPLFVFDQNDKTNQPVKGVHINELRLWNKFPDFVREKFEEIFSQESMIGRDQEHRVMEKDWQAVFIKLRDCLIKCNKCSGETFYIPSKQPNKCLSWGKALDNMLSLNGKKYEVILTPGKNLYACHTLYDSDDYKQVTGEVVSSKNNPNVLGLRNCTGQRWEATIPTTRERRPVEPGKVIKIGKGLKINFGNGNIGDIC